MMSSSVQTTRSATSFPRAGKEIAALVLMSAGSLLIPVLGWIVGATMMWRSRFWKWTDKLVGTLVLPGGLLFPFSLGFWAGEWQTCNSIRERVVGQSPRAFREVIECTPSGGLPGPLLAVLQMVLTLAALASITYLAIRLSRERRTAPLGHSAVDR